MIICPAKLFQFIRGALRGAYGTEDLHSRKFLIIGVAPLGQAILGRLCLPEVDILVQERSVGNYTKIFAVCGHVDVYSGDFRDVIIDTESECVIVKNRKFLFSNIGDDPYSQGIHEAYL